MIWKIRREITFQGGRPRAGAPGSQNEKSGTESRTSDTGELKHVDGHSYEDELLTAAKFPHEGRAVGIHFERPIPCFPRFIGIAERFIHITEVLVDGR